MLSRAQGHTGGQVPFDRICTGRKVLECCGRITLADRLGSFTSPLSEYNRRMTDDKLAAGKPPDSVLRVVIASFIGTTIEWYDFFLYGTASALVFNRLFFPKLDPRAGIMASFATYAVGFFARPVGSVVFGHFGDRMGRKSMLVTTLVLMGLATFLIGVLPTYDQIGVAAPVMLVVLRFVQGFGVGGEWGGAVLMVVEHGQHGRRGLYASWVQAGVPAGLIIANSVFNLFNSSLPVRPFELGLADPVSPGDCRARHRPVHTTPDPGKPAVREGPRTKTTSRHTFFSRSCGGIRKTSCWRSALAWRRTAASTFSRCSFSRIPPTACICRRRVC